MSAANVYTKEIHDQLERYATWLPTDKITVGTVGQLVDKRFIPVSDVQKFGIRANVVKDPDTKASYKFVSSGTNEIAVAGSASGVPTSVGFVAAKLNINFSKANSVYFSLSGCTGSAIDDLISLGNQILDLVKKGRWQVEYAVVTRVVIAESATILQAQSNKAAIEFEGDSSGTPVLDLLKAGAKVNMNSQKSVGLNIFAEKRLTPLFSLAKVEYSFLDRILKKDPKWSYAVPREDVALKQIISHVNATPNIDVKSNLQNKTDLSLSVKLPKFGDYVDVSHLIDLTSKISAVRPKGAKKKPATLPDKTDLCTRVPGKDLLRTIDNLPHVNVDEAGMTDNFVHLNLRLPKSGSTVSTNPLFNLVLKAAKPKTRVNVNAELSFGEIA
jgi:hypothetical protein